jgi:hypothetical protein
MNNKTESPEGNLEDENDFLKMKLMLENGAKFGTMNTDTELPPEVENMFLKNMMEFERQAAERKKIKVFDKIGRPTNFRPVNQIAESEIENEWKLLIEHLNQYSIDLDVCSPNISKRELYRFTTEELFAYEMDDMSIEGMTSGFIYDEFYPDHIYDNTRYAVDDCIKLIFNPRQIDFMPWLKRKNLSLNDHYPLTEEDFKKRINQFKEAYKDIKLNKLLGIDCEINENCCEVKGEYDISLVLPSEERRVLGSWRVEFELDEDGDYWQIVSVQVENIRF